MFRQKAWFYFCDFITANCIATESNFYVPRVFGRPIVIFMCTQYLHWRSLIYMQTKVCRFASLTMHTVNFFLRDLYLFCDIRMSRPSILNIKGLKIFDRKSLFCYLFLKNTCIEGQDIHDGHGFLAACFWTTLIIGKQIHKHYESMGINNCFFLVD